MWIDLQYVIICEHIFSKCKLSWDRESSTANHAIISALQSSTGSGYLQIGLYSTDSKQPTVVSSSAQMTTFYFNFVIIKLSLSLRFFMFLCSPQICGDITLPGSACVFKYTFGIFIKLPKHPGCPESSLWHRLLLTNQERNNRIADLYVGHTEWFQLEVCCTNIHRNQVL